MKSRLCLVASFAGFISSFFHVAAVAQKTPHPLDDLSAAEITKTVAIVRASKRFSADIRFAMIAAQEPPKAQVLALGVAAPRRALVLAYDPQRNIVDEVRVDLSAGEIVSVDRRKDVQPLILIEEYELVRKLVRADVRFVAAIKKRGISDMNQVYIDGWAPGLLTARERQSGKRLMRAVPFLKAGKTNVYARPIEGLRITLDMNKRQVIDVIDAGPVPIAPGHRDLDKSAEAATHTTLPDICSRKIGSPVLSVHGRSIEWEGWQMRFAMHPMHGLMLYQVSYRSRDGEPPRGIVYKASLAEMVVPYGDPSNAWSFRNAFDVGEYGIGKTAHSLKYGIDVPAGARLYSAVFADDSGTPFEISDAIAIYEFPSGVLWKHMDSDTRVAQARAGKTLHIGFMTTIGNYDYGLDWVFHQDGTIELQAKLTGMLLAKAVKEKQNPCVQGCLPLVEPQVLAPPHQHFFSFRLDTDIDGADHNAPYRMDVSAIPRSAANPDGNAFEMHNTLLPSERVAIGDLNPATARTWKIVSTARKNSLGHPTGYMIVPGENAVPYLDRQSPIRKRAGFIDHTIWFTRYRDAEQNSAGDYPNQSRGGEGLPKWAADNERLEDQDVVLWYTFGVTHIPRPEEWPIMNVHKTGFKLMPINFFDHNPAVD